MYMEMSSQTLSCLKDSVIVSNIVLRGTIVFIRPLSQYILLFSTENNMANKEDKYNTTTQLTKNNGIVFNSIVENQFNYDVKFGKHALNAMVATTYEKYTSETANAYKTGGPGNDDAFHVLDSQTTGDLAGGTKSRKCDIVLFGTYQL